LSLFLFLFGNLWLAHWLLDIAGREVFGTWSPWLQRLRILELLCLRFDDAIQVLDILCHWNQVQLDRIMRMWALFALWTRLTCYSHGFKIKFLPLINYCVDVMLVFGFHFYAIFLVVFLLVDVLAHFVLSLLHFDWVAICIDACFRVFVCVGAKHLVELVDFAKSLDVLLDLFDVFLLIYHVFFCFLVEVFDQTIQEDVLIICITNIRTHLLNIELQRRNISSIGIDAFEELIIKVLFFDFLDRLGQL